MFAWLELITFFMRALMLRSSHATIGAITREINANCQFFQKSTTVSDTT